MRSIVIRGGLAAAGLVIIFLAHGFASQANAQQAAVADLRLAAKGEWDAGTTYAKDDIVTARGSSWISLRPNNLNKVPGQTQPSTAAYWQLFARGFNPTGEWSSSTKYQPDDLVTQNGQTYRAKITNQNRQPNHPTIWELFAAKGAPGPNTGVPDGTQNAPAISFSNDSNTGIYSPGAGKIALVEDGVPFLHNLGVGNTALGQSALGINTSGGFNTALGALSLASNTTGGNNTALGPFALASNTTGGFNSAVGSSALNQNTTGGNNVALGYQALTANTTASDNTAIGEVALANNTTGNVNTAVGSAVLANNTTGSSNTAIGQNAMFANTTGTLNTAIGQGALSSNTTGGQNNAFGQFALTANTTGSQNIAIGQLALSANTTANGNLALGNSALAANTTGPDNLAIGANALGSNTTGSLNTVVGLSALNNNIDGVGNIALGQDAGTVPVHANTSIFIGSGGESGDNEVIRIGTTNAQFSTFIAGIKDVAAGGSGVQVYVDTATGQLTGPPVSSARYKEDILPVEDLTDVLNKLRPVTFRYKKPAPDGSKPLQYGLIAEEVAKVMPYLAVFNADGTLRTVHYDRLPTFLLAGWQAQQKTIAVQAEKIEALSNEARRQKEINAALEARLARLEMALPQTKAAALH